MSQANVDILRRALTHHAATGEHLTEVYAPDFVWDMSKYRGWPEARTYEGIEGLRRFLNDWEEVFDWEFEVESLHDAGDRVVSVISQRGRTKAAGPNVEMCNGLVWTLRDGKLVRADNYADPSEALRAAGLPGDGAKAAV
jgi:ketosteroid isomerase-like protein